jgi:regulator of sigma E protease
MEGMIMTAQLLLSLSILIVVHEWGHYITARMFDIKVEKFYLFFDFLFPMANVLNFSLFKIKRGDTEFGVGWFPLGGYVKIAGMVDESMDKEQMKTAPEPWEFRSKPAWQRLIVMLGGIIVNVITGIIIFIGITYWIGDRYLPMSYINENGGVYAKELAQEIGIQSGDKITKINGKPFENFDDLTKPDVLLSSGSYYTIVRGQEEMQIPIPSDFIDKFNDKSALARFIMPVPRMKAQVEAVADSTVAKRVGLQKGDQFVEINGQPVSYFDEVEAIMKSYVGDTLSFTVSRAGQLLAFKELLGADRKIGFYPSNAISKEELKATRYSFGESVGLGAQRAFGVIFVQVKAFKKMFSGDLSFRKSLSGPVGMAQMYGGKWDWERFWRMTGLLSMVLAFMNFLPIPALDGGYVVFLLYEMVSGKEPSEKVFETALKIGMGLLLLLMVFVFYNDFAKLFS